MLARVDHHRLGPVVRRAGEHNPTSLSHGGMLNWSMGSVIGWAQGMAMAPIRGVQSSPEARSVYDKPKRTSTDISGALDVAPFESERR